MGGEIGIMCVPLPSCTCRAKATPNLFPVSRPLLALSYMWAGGEVGSWLASFAATSPSSLDLP